MAEEVTTPRYARVLEVIIGVVFIAGAVLKAIDMDAFYIQIAQYHVIDDDNLIKLAAWGTLLIETVLGGAMIAAARFNGLVPLVALALLTVFTGLIAYAWMYHDLADCGCFGAFLAMSPGVSIFKNIVMAAMVGIAWRGHRGEAPEEWPKLGVAAAVLSAVLVIVGSGYGQQNATPPTQTSDVEASKERPFAHLVVSAADGPLSLGEGEYLVAALSATCDHCMATVPALNELSLFPEIPTVVSLIMGNAGEIDTFKQLVSPEFPLLPLPDLELFKFVGPAPPRFHYVVDGISVKHWDDEPPTLEELLLLTEEQRATGS